jgi:hypothetical protein
MQNFSVLNQALEDSGDTIAPYRAKVEYVWLDGYTPEPNLRSKTKIVEISKYTPAPEDLPEWGFDGSKSSVVIDMHHGWQGGRKSGAKINQAELDFSMSNADIVLRGHSHDRQAHVFESVRVQNKSLIPWPRVYVNGGTFKTGNINSTGKASDRGVDDTWEETRGFRRKWGTLIGPPPIVVKAKRRTHKGDEHPPFTYEVRI